MADGRFYATNTNYVCPICQMALRWEKREDSDGLILVHYVGHCQNSGRKFYAPVHNLTEFKEDSGG